METREALLSRRTVHFYKSDPLPEGALERAENRPRLLAALRERFDDADADRPAMLGASAVGEIDEVYAARDGVYRGLAHETVSAEGTARDVLAVLRSAVDQAARE